MLNNYRKLDTEKFSQEEYGAKSYLSSMILKESRTFFSARARVLQTIKWNFKGNAEYAAVDYVCECEEHCDDPEGLLSCRLYESHREGLDLANSNFDLVKYYQLIIEERTKEEGTKEKKDS